MVASREARWSFVPSVLGLLLFAAGAADGHDLVDSTRSADWPLLIRADLELLGGYWLFSGRFAIATRIAAIAAFGSILACDLTRAVAGHPSRFLFGHVSARPWWILFIDLVVVAGLLRWRTAPKATTRLGSHPARLAAPLLIAAALGTAIDRSQVGQFPIIATARAGR
jgi:hypothetical protein